jgi:hypothetical protein
LKRAHDEVCDGSKCGGLVERCEHRS